MLSSLISGFSTRVVGMRGLLSRRPVLSRVCVAAGVAAFAPVASAQCARTLPGALSPEIQSPTTAIVWDRDGAGPEAPLLVIAAQAFTTSPTGAQNLIGWDGQKYVKMFTGSPPDVTFPQLFIHAGQLYGLSSTNQLVQFNASSWTNVTPAFGVINEATSFNGEIVVCGTQQGTSAKGVFALRGGAWVQLGASFNADVNSIAIASGQLVAAGAFTLPGSTNIRAAYFDGAAWQPLGNASTVSPGNFTATRIRAVGDKVMVGNDVVIAILGAGTWTRSTENGKICGTTASAIYVNDHTTSSGFDPEPIKAYDGQAWTMLDLASQAYLYPISAVLDYQGKLVAVGTGNLGGGKAATRVGTIELVEGRWRPFGEGPQGPVRSMALASDGNLVTLCGLRGTSNENDNIYTFPSHPFARSWNGARCSPAGTALPGAPNVNNPPASVFYELTADSEFGMLAGGYFYGDYGGTPLASVVQYVPGGDWGSFGSRLFKFKDSSNNLLPPRVYRVLRYQGELLAIGEFSLTSAADNASIARYENGEWKPLAPSMAYPAGSRFRDGFVFDGKLFLVGPLVGSPGNTTTYFDSVSWTAPSSALSANSAFCVHAGELYAAGNGGSTVVRWNGSGWVAVGAALPGTTYALASYRGSLFAGGTFGMRKFDGAAWVALQNVSVFGAVQSLLEHNGELVIGTDGTVNFSATGVSNSATGLARYTADNIPVILQQPLSRTGACGETTTLTVTTANYGPSSYHWYKDNVLLANGATGTGSVLSGVSTRTLSIANLGSGDAGAYTCKISVSTLCGNRTTEPAVIAVTCCPADMNGDDVVDDLDFVLFQVSYDTLVCGSPSMPVGCQADFNNDGFVDDADFVLFSYAYDELVCP
ncbi:MAG: immunoglobulin domain-containing protein [Planctomycetes bacterium]|nr:immunoglobulin domain-containing protein [Planctomycetota bacterium]